MLPSSNQSDSYPLSVSDKAMADERINIDVDIDSVKSFNQKMYDLYYTTRPDYKECLLRCKIMNLFNEIWQNYLIEKEQNAMINQTHQRYAKLIDDDSFIEVETLKTHKTKPYRKYESLTSDNDNEAESKYNSKSSDDAANHWCTSIEGNEKLIVVRKYENGPIIKKITVPAVMIFGSIAFGLDGVGSDMDIALPAGIHKPAVDAHLDSQLQVKLLRTFMQRLKLNSKKCKELGLEWKVEPILHARVPIIKLTEKRATGGKLSVDIGIRSTQMPITKLIRFYANYEERVPVFYTFIKRWSKARQVSDAMHGYPNSFGFVMLVTKFLQILHEPIIPIMDFDKKRPGKLYQIHGIDKFKLNTMTCLELATSFFDYYFNFDFESYQIDITTAGLQWKHSQDYNLNHHDQETMLIEDPSSKSENVTRCLKPYNLKIMKEEFFRGYKCAMNGDWKLLMQPYSDNNRQSIWDIYPPINEYEDEIRYEMEANDEDEELWGDADDGFDDGYFDGYNRDNHPVSGSEAKRQHHGSYAPVDVIQSKYAKQQQQQKKNQKNQKSQKNQNTKGSKTKSKSKSKSKSNKSAKKAAKISNHKKWERKKANFEQMRNTY